MPIPISFSSSLLSRSPIPHIMQETSWDCGLACLAMVLRGLGVYSVTVEELASSYSTQNIWTIDLAYLLAKYIRVDFTYYTSYIGCNPKHETQKVPKKQGLFSKYSKKLQCFKLWNKPLEYIGHFIVLIGYDSSTDKFVYRDPAMREPHCIISAEKFESSRRFAGTDDDCLFTCAFALQQCTPPTDDCGPVMPKPGPNFTLPLNLFSRPNFKGEQTTINVNGPYACVNDIPNYEIKSLLSTGSIQLTLHYGKDCVGHVLNQYNGGSSNVVANQYGQNSNCPGSIFVKFHRYGSC